MMQWFSREIIRKSKMNKMPKSMREEGREVKETKKERERERERDNQAHLNFLPSLGELKLS
jgi:hypothetical protein